MRTNTLSPRPAFLMLFVLVPLLVAGALSTAEVAQRIGWGSDPAAVASAGRPALVFFTADWCAPCREMKATTWQDDAVVAASAPYEPLMVDTTADPATAGRYGVSALPVTLLLGPDGEELARRTGFVAAEEMAALLAEHAPVEK